MMYFKQQLSSLNSSSPYPGFLQAVIDNGKGYIALLQESTVREDKQKVGGKKKRGRGQEKQMRKHKGKSRKERRREDGKEEMGKKDHGCYCGTPLTGW